MDDSGEIDLEEVLHRRESLILDFKRTLPLNGQGRKELAKDIICFANSQGGTIIVGVDEESHELIGIGPNDFEIHKIHQVARDSVVPSVPVRVWMQHYEGLVLGIVSIPKTHHVHRTQDERVYVRDDDDCTPADSEAIGRLLSESRLYWAKSRRSRKGVSPEFVLQVSVYLLMMYIIGYISVQRYLQIDPLLSTFLILGLPTILCVCVLYWIETKPD